MKLILISLSLCLLHSSCASVDDAGRSYPSTSAVEIYFPENDIPRDDEVMRVLIAEADDMVFTNGGKMQNKLAEESKKKGADGIILNALERRVTGEYSPTPSETKAANDRVRTTERSHSNVNEKKELRTPLIKFKR